MEKEKRDKTDKITFERERMVKICERWNKIGKVVVILLGVGLIVLSTSINMGLATCIIGYAFTLFLAIMGVIHWIMSEKIRAILYLIGAIFMFAISKTFLGAGVISFIADVICIVGASVFALYKWNKRQKSNIKYYEKKEQEEMNSIYRNYSIKMHPLESVESDAREKEKIYDQALGINGMINKGEAI